MEINLRNQVNDFIYENKDSKVFIKIIEKVFTDICNIIDDFPSIVQLNNVSELFLPELSSLLNYNYDYSIPDDISREIIRRLLDVYRKRGTDDSIIMAATYGDNKGWIGDHLFLPETTKSDSKAELIYSYDKLFTHNKSTFSGGHYYPDNTRYRDGVLVISVDHLNEDIKKAVNKVLPAGVRVHYDIKANLEGEGNLGEVDFSKWSILTYSEIDYHILMKDKKVDTLVFSSTNSGNNKRLLSGRRLIFEEFTREIYNLINSSSIISPDMIMKKSYVGLAVRDNFSSNRSSKYAMSGSRTDTIYMMAKINEIKPYDRLYNLSSVAELNIHSTRADVISELEIIS